MIGALRTLCHGLVLMLLVPSAVPAGSAGPAESLPEEPGAGAEGYVSASRQIEEGERWIGEGLVDVRYQGLVIEADRAELDRQTHQLVAEGNVVLQEGERRLAGERLEFNLETREGRLWTVWGYSEPDVYFSAREVAKQGPKRYHLSRPTVTSCNQANPIWQLKASSGTYVVDEYVRLWNSRLEIKGVPVFWLPFFQYPAKRDRATGFLFPSFGSNDVRGFYLANSFFWAISRSYDAALTHEWYPDTASILRSEWNWAPSQGARGSFSSENLFEEGADQTSGRYLLKHNQNLSGGWQIGVDAQYATDETLDREYTNSIYRISQRTRSSDAFIARRWSRWNFGLSMHHAEVLGGSERTDFFLPSVELNTRDLQLAGPLRLRGGLRGANFGTDIATTQYRWQRGDFDPTLSAPLSPFPWLHLKPEATYRLTYYSKSYAPGSNQTEFTDEDFLRRYFRFSTLLTGPVLSRVWHSSGKFYSDKFKHVIEPSVSYDYTSDFDPDAQALNVDSIDRLTRQNQVTFALRNRFYAKRAIGRGGVRVPYEFLTISASMGYSLDPDLATRIDGRNPVGVTPGFTTSRRGPLLGDVRISPTPGFLLTYRVAYDTENTVFAQQSVQGSWRAERLFAELSWSRNAGSEGVTAQTLRGRLGTSLFDGKIDVGGSASYDTVRSTLLESGAQLVFHTQCCGIGAGWQRRNIGTLDDNEFRFSLSLKNIGTVFDYTTGDDQL